MTRFTSRLAVTALAAVAPLAPAVAQGLTAIRAGRLVDAEKGEVRRDQLVLVRGERIESVQPASAKIPQGARVIDLSRYKRWNGDRPSDEGCWCVRDGHQRRR